jgi:cytidine deaminase
LFTLPVTANANDGESTASKNWNNSAAFQTSYDKLTKSVIAELIEKQDNGFYDGFDQYNTYHIGAQTTTIGAQTIFNDSDLDHVFVTTTNCGETSSITSVESSGTNQSTATGATCEVTTSNANNN